jgi:hypothetical protein
MRTRLRPSATPAAAVGAAVLLVAACAGRPAPDWKSSAQAALERAVAADLAGEARVAQAEYAQARNELARTGRADLVARAELTRCAVRTASLSPEACDGFEALRGDSGTAERAYADYLAGRAADAALLPPQHRPFASPALEGDAAAVALRGVADPLARLVAAGVLVRRGATNRAAIEVAVDTASDQGWRRPLLAWLTLQRTLAEQAGDTAAADRLRRRIELVAGQR